MFQKKFVVAIRNFNYPSVTRHSAFRYYHKNDNKIEFTFHSKQIEHHIITPQENKHIKTGPRSATMIKNLHLQQKQSTPKKSYPHIKIEVKKHFNLPKKHIARSSEHLFEQTHTRAFAGVKHQKTFIGASSAQRREAPLRISQVPNGLQGKKTHPRFGIEWVDSSPVEYGQKLNITPFAESRAWAAFVWLSCVCSFA